jgi:hypothetical protein
MMNAKSMFSGALILAATLLGGSARADLLEGLGAWRGVGSVFDGDGQPQGDFTVTLTRAAAGRGRVDTRGVATFSSGQVVPFEQHLRVEAGKFLLDSKQGKGAGFCLGADMCQSYEDRGNAQATVTVIVIDGPASVRVLITELDHGRAVRLIRQTLTKQ